MCTWDKSPGWTANSLYELYVLPHVCTAHTNTWVLACVCLCMRGERERDWQWWTPTTQEERNSLNQQSLISLPVLCQLGWLSLLTAPTVLKSTVGKLPSRNCIYSAPSLSRDFQVFFCLLSSFNFFNCQSAVHTEILLCSKLYMSRHYASEFPI